MYLTWMSWLIPDPNKVSIYAGTDLVDLIVACLLPVELLKTHVQTTTITCDEEYSRPLFILRDHKFHHEL